MTWTNDKVLHLRELRASGKSFLECATALGVSRNVIAGKCDRLGLCSSRRPRKPKPVPLINPAVNAHKRDLYADLRRAVENTK